MRFVLLLFGLAALSVLGVMLKEGGGKRRLDKLESHIRDLRALPHQSQQRWSKQVPADSRSRAAPDLAEPLLSNEIRDLSLRSAKIRDILLDLEANVSRSIAVFPTEAEFKIQFERGRKELHRLRESAQSAWDDALRVAKGMGVEIAKDDLLNAEVSQVLEVNRAFVAAREAARIKRNQTMVFEQRLAVLRFAIGLGKRVSVKDMIPAEEHMDGILNQLADHERRFSLSWKEARRIALSANIRFDESQLLNSGGIPALVNNEEFSRTAQANLEREQISVWESTVAGLEFTKAVGSAQQQW